MSEILRDWMSVPEAARLKGVAESSVRLTINAGRLTGGKIGRNYVVSRRDIEEWNPTPRASRCGRRASEEPRVRCASGTSSHLSGGTAGSVNEADADLRAALLEFLSGGSTDQALKRRILELNGGPEALRRVERIQEGRRQFAGRGLPTEDYFRHKREEVEAEQRREESRNAESP